MNREFSSRQYRSLKLSFVMSIARDKTMRVLGVKYDISLMVIEGSVENLVQEINTWGVDL